MTPRLLPIALLGLLSLPVTAFADNGNCRYTVRHRATLDAAGATKIEILARAGSLTVKQESGGALVAEGKACASSQSLLDEIQLRTRRDGDVLQVVAELPGEMQGMGIFYASLDLVISVPGDLPVDITDTSGEMTVDRVRLERIRDSSGDIVARNVRGDFHVEDSSGDLRVEDAQGNVSIADSSGDIVVRGAAGVHIIVDSSGDIDIQQISGDVRIERDSSGNIRIAGIGGNVEVLADGSGKVRVSDTRGTVHVP